MPTQKCLLIDALTQTVSETTFEDLPGLQKLVGGYIETAFQWPNGDTLYVDEEGLLKGPVDFFRIPQRPDQALAGNGVVVGREVEGPKYPNGFTNLDPTMTLDGLRALVSWGR